MARYYDIDKLKEMIEAKADTLIEGKQAFLYVAKWLDLLPPADVVPRAEVEKLELKFAGVMWSVDKWLDGDELAQDEVKRAITMREKTLRIVEGLQAEVNRVYYNLQAVLEERAATKGEVAREIFEEVEKTIETFCAMTGFDVVFFGKYAELKKKYTEGGESK